MVEHINSINKKLLFGIIFLIFIIGCAQQQKQESRTQQTTEVINMHLTSSAFKHNGTMPSEFTCDGSNINPPLSITGVPANAKSLVLIVDDPDAVVGVWDHWVVFNINPSISEIKQDTQPQGVAGKNSGGRNSYQGPCPPSGTHRYFFKLYALDATLNLPEGSTKKQVEPVMQSHILTKSELIGLYKRINNQ
ncbi:MAG TPA: YbhB/YbcL family Raf kinase inhibitor-like protein [Candidatus Nanoarchaeia archaeon]|nr:YbhB/YbcL family Raf kinase inhibitor-like protein [Candidatus Nanoarchaeia archaeon]